MSNGTDRRNARGLPPSPAERTAAARAANAARYQGAADQYRMNQAKAADIRQFAPFAAQRATPVQQSSWERALSTGLGTMLPRTPDSDEPPAAPPSYVPGGNDVTITTDPSNPAKPDPYPTVLPALSSAQLGALAERRRIVDQRLKQAETESQKRRELLEASATRSRTSAERKSKRSIEDFMREAAGAGLARSPMVAGRQVRRAGEDLRLTYGEIDTQLSTEIAALQDLVSQAELARSEEIASISQDEANMRSDVERLLPAAQTYT